MVRYNNNKLGEIIDSKVVNLANNDVIKLHQRAKLNGVVDSKLKSLEKEKSINEIKKSSYRESKAPKIEEVNFVVIDKEDKKISSKEAIEKIERKNLNVDYIASRLDILNLKDNKDLLELVILNIKNLDSNDLDRLNEIAKIFNIEANSNKELALVILEIIKFEATGLLNSNWILLNMSKPLDIDKYGKPDLLYYNKFTGQQVKLQLKSILNSPKDVTYLNEISLFNDQADKILFYFYDRDIYENQIKLILESRILANSKIVLIDASTLTEKKLNVNTVVYIIDKYNKRINICTEEIKAIFNIYNDNFDKKERPFLSKKDYYYQLKHNNNLSLIINKVLDYGQYNSCDSNNIKGLNMPICEINKNLSNLKPLDKFSQRQRKEINKEYNKIIEINYLKNKKQLYNFAFDKSKFINDINQFQEQFNNNRIVKDFEYSKSLSDNMFNIDKIDD